MPVKPAPRLTISTTIPATPTVPTISLTLANNAYPDVYQPFVRTVSMTAVSMSPTGWNRTMTGLLVTVSVSRDGVELVKLQRIAWQ